MAKVKKMADGGMTGLGQLLGGGKQQTTRMPSEFFGMPGRPAPPIGGGGGGGSAQDGINQINSGAQTVSGAIGSAQNALGGGGGAIPEPQSTFKKGGSVGKTATKVTTASKNKTTPNW
jgi:hypothetical protein